MKVLYVIDTLEESGAERSLTEITKKFKKIDPVFVHIYEGDALKKELLINNIKVYSLNLKGTYSIRQAKKKLTEIYLNEKPDIVHATLFRSDLITRILKRRFSSIILISSYVNNSYHPDRFQQSSLALNCKLKFIRFIDKYFSPRVDFFISNSLTIKEAKSKATNVPLEKVKVIYRGREVSNFDIDFSNDEVNKVKKELGLKHKKVLLNVSRLIERKGQKDLINAMPEILKSKPDTILLIAGDGPFRKDLSQLIKKLGLEKEVILLGRRNDIPLLMSITDLFVFPSYFEGLPGALIEAMMAEKTIVCSDIPENKECVNENSAIFFNRGNIMDLSNKIIYGLQNSEKLKKLGCEAARVAVDKFDINKIALEYEKTYSRIKSNNQI